MSILICRSEDVGYKVRLPEGIRMELKRRDEGLCLIAVEPATLHRIHLSKEGDTPLCGTASLTGFECVGDVQRDGTWHLNSCQRCLRIFKGETS